MKDTDFETKEFWNPVEQTHAADFSAVTFFTSSPKGTEYKCDLLFNGS